MNGTQGTQGAQTLTAEQIRTTGLRALVEALGPDGALRFLQQFDRGHGDYTAERQTWAASLDLETLLAKIEELRRRRRT